MNSKKRLGGNHAYDLMRYLALNKNQRPFPFNDFPPAMEEPVEEVNFR
ncbi:MAG: hypothetical protein JSV14_09750 [Deltaproteobacteria bacterium]|nr:MAG: hypothetical protein JSV14_09750 [Deltaproteobacteria bacterium]